MIATDIAGAANWIEARWGSQAAWKNWEHFWLDFAPYTAGALKQALNDYYRAGNKFAPKPSELLRLVGEAQVRRLDRGEDNFEQECETHLYAQPLPFDDDRHQRCVRCGESGRIVPCQHLFADSGRCIYCPVTSG